MKFRWLGVITYRTDNGPVEVDHHFDELEELHDIVERGPDWNTIDEIKIVLNPAMRSHSATVEQSRDM